MIITISGQVRGGKNNLVVTRSGHRFPRKSWAAWRDDAVRQVKAQLPTGWKPIDEDCAVFFDYWTGDKRRRDMPAILDSVWHVLEKAGVVTDDTLLWVSTSWRGYDNENPRVEIGIKAP